MKLANDGKCMEGLRPFSVPFTVFIGSPESDYDWDEKVRTLSAFRESAKFLYKVVPGLAKAGAPIWRMDPATVMDRWQRGLPLLFRSVVVTYDAAVYGIGVSVRTDPRQLWRTAGKSYGRLSSVVILVRNTSTRCIARARRARSLWKRRSSCCRRGRLSSCCATTALRLWPGYRRVPTSHFLCAQPKDTLLR